MKKISQITMIFQFLGSNAITLPNSFQVLYLVGALPPSWHGFATTILATVTPNNLNISHILPKIQEEWSHCSKQSQIFTGNQSRSSSHPQQSLVKGKMKKCQKCGKIGHTTSEHQDN